MDSLTWIAIASIISAGLCMGIGAVGPAIGEGLAAARALSAIAQQPDEASTVTRMLFVTLAMIESTAIYSLVVAMIVLFANPYWSYMVQKAGG